VMRKTLCSEARGVSSTTSEASVIGQAHFCVLYACLEATLSRIRKAHKMVLLASLTGSFVFRTWGVMEGLD